MIFSEVYERSKAEKRTPLFSDQDGIMGSMFSAYSLKEDTKGSNMTKKDEEWMQYDKDEVEKLIVKIAKEGKAGSDIGMILRDQYGIPDVRALGLKVSKVLDEHERKEVPDDMFSLLKQAVNLHAHMGRNKHDAKSKHGLEKIESKIRRLVKYYVRKGRLPKDWRYSIEKARLLVK